MQVRIMLMFFFIVMQTAVLAQDVYPKIGEPMPDMVFSNIQYFGKKKTTIKELRGKPLIIDFFSKGCTACFRKLPENNELYNEFNNKVNFIMVGIDLNDGVQQTFEKYKNKLKLNLPVAYDSVYYKQFNIRGVPLLIWIDKDGIVTAITWTMNREQVQLFSEGKKFEFFDGSRDARSKEIDFDADKAFLVNGNGGDDDADFIQRSILSKWKPGMKNYIDYPFPFAENQPKPYNHMKGKEYVQILGRGLAELYRIAFFGRSMNWHASDTVAYGNYHFSPILEVADSSLFQADHNLGLNLFCYSQILPAHRRNPATKMEVMQRDLKNMFGYDVAIETRKMPCLKLTATDKARKNLKTKGGKPGGTYNSIDGGTFDNISVRRLIDAIEGPIGLAYNDLPLIDETGITGNIDIMLNAIIDLEDVKRELRKSGLDIVNGEKEMKCIIIRDPK